MIISCFKPGSLITEIAPTPVAPSTVAGPYIPMEFDLLMQNNLPPTPKPATSPHVPLPPTGNSTVPLLPIAETQMKHLDVVIEKQPRQEGDVSMLDTGTSSTENSIGGNEDVQLLHSPPISTPSAPVAAPSLSDVLLKFEEIKPSKSFWFRVPYSFLFYDFSPSYVIGSKSPISLLSQQCGLNINLHNAFANVPKVDQQSIINLLLVSYRKFFIFTECFGFCPVCY